jgi:glycerol-3-phosphate cytidylyltransferase-like family protein
MTKDEAQRSRWTFYEAVNICYPKAVFRNNTPSKGKAFIKAKWQIAPPRRVPEVNRGEELYAIASPLDEKWRATTSKGIEYAHRGKEGLTDTLTNQIPRGVRSCDQNTISLRKEVVAQNQHRVDEADRLKFFLFLYCHTYESKDIDKFATLFAHDALENNKPFHELLPKYRRNMAMIESLDYRIDLVNYSLQPRTGNIRLQGKFSIRYLLHGGTWKEKNGNISMELTKRGISYLVKRLNYSDEP